MKESNPTLKLAGLRIRKIRKDKKLTLEEFGKLFDPPADKAAVSAWENGKNMPNSQRLKQLSLIGNVSELYITTGIDERLVEYISRISDASIHAMLFSPTLEIDKILTIIALNLLNIADINNPKLNELYTNLLLNTLPLSSGKNLVGDNLTTEEIYEARLQLNQILDEMVQLTLDKNNK
ncbi:helix-turn-helix domain-containing protein [Enterococcus faecalis]|uniref:helix-turn-helix domain-containing protein n=1 Tax=Enterococcus faecalis TaxID=1351 RepID=UPI0039A6E8A9